MGGRLTGRVAIVTGAGAVGPGWGNGRATAVLFAREGASVLLVDRDRTAMDETVAAVETEGGAYALAETDVTDERAVEEMARQCTEAFGRIDILCNNVGGSVPGDAVALPTAEFRAQLDLNLTSAFLTCKAVLPAMRQAGAGAIVNVGSIAGLRHLGHEHVGYSAAKAALIQLSRQIAVRHGPEGIRCNTLIPGMIDTPLLRHRVSRQKGRADLETLLAEAKHRVPLGRRGDAWDIARAALFLVSDEARYITGTELLVDGGLMARSA